MPEYSRKIAPTFAETLAAIPEQKREREQWDGDKDHSRPFESLSNLRAHRGNRARRCFQIRVGNLVRGEDPVLQLETIFANGRDDARAHSSLGKINVHKAVLVHAKILNSEFVAGLFRRKHDWRHGKAAARASLWNRILVGG